MDIRKTVYNAIRTMPVPQGAALSNRYQVKAFRDADARGAFLCRQGDNNWKELNGRNLVSGVYKMVYCTDKVTRITTNEYQKV